MNVNQLGAKGSSLFLSNKDARVADAAAYRVHVVALIRAARAAPATIPPGNPP